jgi:neutral ceramidase
MKHADTRFFLAKSRPVADLIFMGYADSAQVGTGLRQRLYSRAFIVGDVKRPKDRIVYLVLDIQSGDTAVRDGILKGLKAMGPEYAVYTKDNVAVTGTHSHSGPGAWTNYFLHHASTLGFDKQSWGAIVNGSLLSIKKAHESLKEGRITSGKIRIDDANINRSPTSYDANPAAERAQYSDNVDKDMTLLRFADLDNKDIGVLTFFATHGTSLLQNNTLVTGDNKGVAAYLLEKKMQTTSPGFVAAFSQSNVGDVSPNVQGDWCESGPSAGQRCKADDSTCDGKVTACRSRGPFWGLNDAGTKSCYEIGKRQYEKAYELMQQLSSTGGSPVRGPVRSFHTYQDLSFAEFPHPNGSTVMTCIAAMGYSFAAGTTDGPGLPDFKQGLTGSQPAVPAIWPILSGLIKSPSAKNKACHGIKPILLDIGEITSPYQWGPNIVDIQLMRIGAVIIIVSTGEATTQSGRRWKAAIANAARQTNLFADHEATAGAAPTVVLGGPANTYTHYITTEEEYQHQRYEAASTLYGPHTLNGFIHFSVLNLPFLSATSRNATVAGGPSPQVNVDRGISLIAAVPVDRTSAGKRFGEVLEQPRTGGYVKGEKVRVRFQGANPRNNLRLEGTYAAVQVRSAAAAAAAGPPVAREVVEGGGDALDVHLAFADDDGEAGWKTVRDDFDWDLVFEWKKGTRLSPASETTITWETGPDTPAGTYRIVYNGDSRAQGGKISPFQGVSATFVVR